MSNEFVEDKQVIKTFVYHGEKCFYVSTINRPSSAAAAYGHIYAETIVWDYDWPKQIRGEIIYQDEAPAGSISKHQWIVECFHQDGKVEEVA